MVGPSEESCQKNTFGQAACRQAAGFRPGPSSYRWTEARNLTAIPGPKNLARAFMSERHARISFCQDRASGSQFLNWLSELQANLQVHFSQFRKRQRLSRAFPQDSCQLVEAQHRIALPQFARARERAVSIWQIEVLIVLGDHGARGREHSRLR